MLVSGVQHDDSVFVCIAKRSPQVWLTSVTTHIVTKKGFSCDEEDF